MGVANATPVVWAHLKVASTPHIQLIEARVFGLLLPDVFSDHRFASTNGRDEVSPGPEVRPYEVALPLPVNTRQVDGALPLDVPDHLRNAYFGGIDIIM
jgi:hypothetical protein